MPDGLLMPVETPFHGFGVSAPATQDAVGAAAPLVAASNNLKQVGEEEQKKQAAINYQKVLRGGPAMMKQYATEVAGQFPELGAQLQKEAASYEPLFQDPTLDADKAEKITHAFYESANNRFDHLKQTQAGPKQEWKPTTEQEAEDFYQFQQDNKAFPDPKPSAGDSVRSAKRLAALNQLPAAWSQIEDLQRQGGTVPLIPGSMNPDTEKWEKTLPQALRKKWDITKTKLAKLESDAGMQASTDLMGPDLEKSSESYRHYKRVKGMRPGGDSAIQPPATTKPQPPPGLVDWFKQTKSAKDPATLQKRAAALAKLDAQGADTSGL